MTGSSVPDPPSGRLPPAAYLAGLAALSAMWPRRLREVLRDREPERCWSALIDGTLGRSSPLRRRLGDHDGTLVAGWRSEAGSLDLAALWQRYRAAEVGVAARGAPAYPEVFLDDPHPPAVVFHRGAPLHLSGARVAIVGTRRCTRYGRDLAYQLGGQLAEAGVAVVSGLAIGIDAAAHHGALDAAGAPAVAVVGSGLDVIYPRANTDLWQRVAADGLLLGEAPLSCRPEGWRFPARNRLLAALADVVVVVESHVRGGSLSTVDHALVRSRPVMAVPGPVGSPASQGTNRLLADGAAPVLGTDDVLLALGCTPGVHRPAVDEQPPPAPDQVTILDAVGWQPASLEQVVLRSGLGASQAAAGLEALCAAGRVAVSDGWYERTAAPTEPSS